jgi:hypothetical protein
LGSFLAEPQPWPALIIVKDLNVDWTQTGWRLPAFNGRFFGTPQAAKGQPGLRLASAIRNLGTGKILHVERV